MKFKFSGSPVYQLFQICMIVPLNSLKFKHVNIETNEITSKQTNPCSKSTIEILEQGIKYVQN